MDPENEASAEDTQEEDIESEPTDDPSELKARLKKFEEQAIKQRERTRLLKQQLKEQQAKPSETKVEEKQTEPSELDYSQKAFLLAKGIEEFDLVLDEAKKFGVSLKNVKLEDLIENPYFKQRLEETRTTKANELAAGDKNNRGAAGGKNSADYWVAKLGPDEQVPADLPRELRQQIVEARTAKGKSGKMFYSD